MTEHLHAYIRRQSGIEKCIYKGCGHILDEPMKRAWGA